MSVNDATSEHGAGSSWRKSQRCGAAGDCVEVALGSDAVLMRDSKDKQGPILAIAPSAWRSLLSCARAGGLDR